MTKCFWLLNHDITEEQKEELRLRYNVDSFVLPPEIVAAYWAAIPPKNCIPDDLMCTIFSWLSSATEKDIAVVQGEPTAAFKIINDLLDRGVTVLAAVSERCSNENVIDGKSVKTSYFKHICFREYKK